MRTRGGAGWGNYGGGVLGNGTLSNCTLTGNASASYGGGAADGRLYNCMLIGNYTEGNGGGALGGALSNCTLIGNVAVNNGGGTWLATLYNCLLTRNQSEWGGGGAADSTLYNCTIVSNRTTAEGWGGGFHIGLAGRACNTIIYSNLSATANLNNWSTNVANVTFSNCCTTPTNSSSGILPGTGNITNYPMFIDPMANFRLTNNSPCVNRGTNQSWMTTGTDLDGLPRIRERTVDMGTYEFIPSGTIVTMH